MNWLADINVQGLRGNIVGKTWQDVGGKPSLDKARDKKATNYRFDQRCASQSQINSCPKKLGNKSGMLARDQVSSVWQGSIYLNSVAFFNTNVKHWCRFFNGNQTFLQSLWCKPRNSLVPKSWSPYDFEMGRFYLCISRLFLVNACNSPQRGFLRARNSTSLFFSKST